MALFSAADQRLVSALTDIIYSNPFLPERTKLGRQLLGADFADVPWDYNKVDDLDHEHPALTHLDERVENMAAQARQRLLERVGADEDELALYDSLATYLLYRRYRGELLATIARGLERRGEPPQVPFWKRFLADFHQLIAIPGRRLHGKHDPAYLLAGMFQVRRAFYQIYHHIAGASKPAARLRAAVWQSIFTHDMERYYVLDFYAGMGRFPTLITGASGTGKELVARAIGLSRFIPFDPQRGQFVADFAGSYHALNLLALAPTLVESELFGHCKGAFTGAVRDQPGWLEKCTDLGAVFLDEIGELDPAIQVKLLRVLQERVFYRLGETRERRFQGKIIAATNRDLAAEMHSGKFRQDLFYRLCADMIATPSLHEQLADNPGDLSNLVRFILKRIAPHAVEPLAHDVEHWIRHHPRLKHGYAWPGNFRELEQCVWNVLIRREYHPPRAVSADDPHHELAEAIQDCRLTADELERRYYTLVFAQTGNYQEASRRLGRNWRTIKGKIDQDLLRRLRSD